MNRIRSLTYYFDLIYHLVKCDFSLRYKGSTFGVLWSIMLPLAQLLVLVFVFKKVIPLDIDAYPAFVFSALLPWTWFSSSLNTASRLFINNRGLLWRPNFSPVNLIIVNTLSNLLIYLIVMPILFGVLIFYGRAITLTILILPLLIVIQGIFIVGLGLIIATLNVFYRDVEHIVNVFLMLLFYLTPVFYWSQDISKDYYILYKINPVAVLIQSYRSIFFYSTYPDWSSLLLLGIASIAMFGLSYFVYNRQLHNVIDTI
ncbi:MAG: ABC transporter permease [wastewater metagenome]|nr:ABC transporter permease [Candidatus Loosdrechtia aerotolerans]